MAKGDLNALAAVSSNEETQNTSTVYLKIQKSDAVGENLSITIPQKSILSLIGIEESGHVFSLPLLIHGEGWFPGFIDSNFDGEVKFMKYLNLELDQPLIVGLNIDFEIGLELMEKIMEQFPNAFSLAYPGDGAFTANVDVIQKHEEAIRSLMEEFIFSNPNHAIGFFPRSSWRKATHLTPWTEIHSARFQETFQLLSSSLRYQCAVLKRNEFDYDHNQIHPVLKNFLVPFKIHSIDTDPTIRQWGCDPFNQQIVLVGQPDNHVAIFIFASKYFDFFIRKGLQSFLSYFNECTNLLTEFENKISGIIIYNRDIVSRGTSGFGSSDNVKSDQILISKQTIVTATY